MNDLVTKLRERYEALKQARGPWETLWDEIARYVMPRRVPGLNGTVQNPSTENETRLFDTTAIEANLTLGNGQLAWMSPLESAWFAYEPQEGLGDDARRWLAKATESARNALAVSNFYTAVHEFYLDRGAFGTACLYAEPGKKGLINAQVWPVGTFVVDEDDEGNVDTVMRCFKLTPRQAIQKFGEERVSKKVRELSAKGGAGLHAKLDFIHAIYPREDAERDQAKLDDVNMPIASVYFEAGENHVCKVSGYEEMPVFVSRYLEWGSGMGGMYGWSPAWFALPEARQLNFMEKMLDALAEKAAFPPVLAPDELEGEIDPNAFGVTYFSKELAGNLPREWMTQGRYDIGLQRSDRRQEAIRKAFHTDLFKMFSQIEKQMTAREVSERAQEKLMQFSPTFARLTSELFNPLLERVFGILLRSGRLGEVPPGMIVPLGGTRGFVVPPRVQYSSRIALALRSLPTIGYQRTLERAVQVSRVAPETMDNFDFDEAERATALNDGMPADFLRPEKDVEQRRAARAQAAAAQQQQAQAMAAAEAVAKVGQVPADSPVGKAMEAQIPQRA